MNTVLMNKTSIIMVKPEFLCRRSNMNRRKRMLKAIEKGTY